VRRDDAERFIEGVRGDDPEITAKLRIEERELSSRRALNYPGLTASGDWIHVAVESKGTVGVPLLGRRGYGELGSA